LSHNDGAERRRSTIGRHAPIGASGASCNRRQGLIGGCRFPTPLAAAHVGLDGDERGARVGLGRAGIEMMSLTPDVATGNRK
jgi:sulfopyruvate decarboxylase TPP-binding subunit